MTVLEEAGNLVDGVREKEYSHPYENFTAVTEAARALGVDPESGPLHHALYMVIIKVHRLVITPEHHDSLVDIPGYARTYEKVLDYERQLENDGIETYTR